MNQMIVNNGQFLNTSAMTDDVASDILSFLSLPRNWCYGVGRPGNPEAVFGALSILSFLRELSYEGIEAFPDVSGDVLLSALTDGVSIEILCKGDGLFNVADETNNDATQEFSDLDKATVFEKLRELSCIAPKKSSDFYTLSTIASQSVDLLALLSRTSTAEYPWLTHSASPPQEPAFASILSGTIPTSVETLPFTGSFLPRTYQMGLPSSQPSLTAGTNATEISSGWLTPFAPNGSRQSQLMHSGFARQTAVSR